MTSYGFSFKGVTSASVGISMATPLRAIKPALREIEYTIPGMSGTVSYAKSNIYEKTTVQIPIIYTSDTVANLNATRRAIAYFLSGRGQLIFDDEPDKAYMARVVESPAPTEIINIGKAVVAFDCQPFAEDITYNEDKYFDEAIPITKNVVSNGTQNTPCVITITAKSSIDSLTIQREVTV